MSEHTPRADRISGMRVNGLLASDWARSVGRRSIARWALDALRLRAMRLDRPSARGWGGAMTAERRRAA